MKFDPLPQQVQMIQHILDHEDAAIFADMGLGKTSATLAAIATLITDFEIKGVLIVAPLRVCLLTWPNECKLFDEFRWLRVADMRTYEGKQAWHFNLAHIYLINYDMLPSFTSHAWGIAGRKELPVDMIVWDELSKAKNPNSKRIKCMLAYRSFFKRHVGLTGTPTPNSYLELHPQMRLLDGGKRLGTQFTQFRRRYFESDYMGYKWTIHDWSKPKIEEKIADMTLTMRKKEWMDIPPTEVVDVDVHLPLPLVRQYKELQKELLIEINSQEIVALNAATLVQKLLQFTSGAIYDADRNIVDVHACKVRALSDLVHRLSAPVLVACQFIHERQRVLESIEGAEEFREDRLEAWNRGEIPCWVADPRSIGHGLNLQAGSCNIIWFSLTYSRELYDQMNARLIRTGQDKLTTIWRLMVPHSVDDAVAEALRIKGDQQSGLMQALTNIQLISQTAVCP